DLGLLDKRELLQLSWILAMVRGIVVSEINAVDVRTVLGAEPQRDDACRVRLQGEPDDVIPLPRALQELWTGKVADGSLVVNARLGSRAPVFVLLQRLLGFAQRREE